MKKKIKKLKRVALLVYADRVEARRTANIYLGNAERDYVWSWIDEFVDFETALEWCRTKGLSYVAINLDKD